MKKVEKYHSPFMVFDEFVSAKACEQIIENVDFKDKNSISVDWIDHPLQERFNKVIPLIETHYNVKHRLMEEITFEKYPENNELSLHSENSRYFEGKWIRTKDRDFTGVLFLSDWREQTPFDSRYEVYGGKMEFPQWGFGFQAVRGTLIIFPSDAHFINKINKIQIGTLYRAVVHFASDKPFLWDIKNFPGDYTKWFS